MHGGSRTGDDVTNKGRHIEKWVKKSTRPMLTFELQQEKETYQKKGRRY
jgi:hypothetical protein